MLLNEKHTGKKVFLGLGEKKTQTQVMNCWRNPPSGSKCVPVVVHGTEPTHTCTHQHTRGRMKNAREKAPTPAEKDEKRAKKKKEGKRKRKEISAQLAARGASRVGLGSGSHPVANAPVSPVLSLNLSGQWPPSPGECVPVNTRWQQHQRCHTT